MPNKDRDASEWARQSKAMWQAVASELGITVAQAKQRYGRRYSLHHQDHNRANNDVSNLVLVDKREHSRESAYHQRNTAYNINPHHIRTLDEIKARRRRA